MDFIKLFVVIFCACIVDINGCQVEQGSLYCKCDEDPAEMALIPSQFVALHRYEPNPSTQITYLNRKWYKLEMQQRLKIDELHINDCKIEHLEDLSNIELFTNVQRLELRNLEITTFNFDFIANNHKLASLVLDDNLIDSFFGDLSIFSRLEYLSINQSNFRQLPLDQLGQLPNLHKLYASGLYLEAPHNLVCDKLPNLKVYNGKSCLLRYESVLVIERNSNLINEVLPNNLIGCEFSTLRGKPGDIILTQEEMLYIKILIYAMIGCISIVLLGLLLLCFYLKRQNSHMYDSNA